MRRIARRFAIFEPGTVVRFPFPYVEREDREVRPALVVANFITSLEIEIVWALMITSAANRGWPDDYSLESRYPECGLPAPSVIRLAKIASLETARATRIGVLPEDIWDDVRVRLVSRLTG